MQVGNVLPNVEGSLGEMVDAVAIHAGDIPGSRALPVAPGVWGKGDAAKSHQVPVFRGVCFIVCCHFTP